MNIEEIRNLSLGDWVSWGKLFIRITGLMYGGVKGVFNHHELINWLTIDDVEPIPLTQSLFEANGFKVDGYAILNLQDGKWLEYYFHEHRFSMYYEGIDEWQNHSQVRDIVFRSQPFYVHELQHCLRLCCLNDLADNLKLEE